MAKLTVEVPRWNWEREPEREQRIRAEILAGVGTGEDIGSAWHAYLKEHLKLPFWAYIIAPNSTATHMYLNRVQLVRLAPPERCQGDQILMIGQSSVRDDQWNYYFLADASKVEADETTIRDVLDYLYWRKYIDQI